MNEQLIFMYSKSAKIINPVDVGKLLSPLPKSWTQAACILRGRKKRLIRHINIVRREWEKRPNK